MSRPEVTIIGAGALGAALARAINVAGVPLKSIYNRSEKRIAGLLETNSDPITGTFPSAAGALGSLVFLTVSDSAIGNTAAQLAALGPLRQKIVVHCSGVETSSILHPLREQGAITAAFHPLQTFNARSTSRAFKDIYFSIEGDEEAEPVLRNVASRLGARVFTITKESKPFLHAGAVFASNYIVTLLDVASDISALGNINRTQALKVLMPLIRTSLDNLESGKPGDVISGPVARGDVATIRKHLELLKNERNLLELYKSLGRETLRLIERNKSLKQETVKEMKETLSGSSDV